MAKAEGEGGEQHMETAPVQMRTAQDAAGAGHKILAADSKVTILPMSATLKILVPRLMHCMVHCLVTAPFSGPCDTLRWVSEAMHLLQQVEAACYQKSGRLCPHQRSLHKGKHNSSSSA